MEFVVSGIKAECPRCKGTEFERASDGEGASDEPPVLLCNTCAARHPYGELLAVVAQRVFEAEARRATIARTFRS
jgi:hypothetical protein